MNRIGFFVLALGLLLLVCAAVGVESLCCGFVADGRVHDIDEDRQSSKRALGANWEGFDGDCHVTSTSNPPRSFFTTGNSRRLETRNNRRFDGLIYEVAFISDDLRTFAINSSGRAAPNDTRCRFYDGLPTINTEPDVQDFRLVHSGNHTYLNSSLNLEKGQTYYAILRVTDIFTGETIYSNSDGVKIVGKSNKNKNSAMMSGGLEDWQAGLIALGVAIYCLLLLLLLLIVLAKGKDDDKYSTSGNRNENVEKV